MDLSDGHRLKSFVFASRVLPDRNYRWIEKRTASIELKLAASQTDYR